VASGRAARGSHLFGLAFGLAALVAVGGVSFAVGRWSMEDSTTNGGGIAGGFGARAAQAAETGAVAAAGAQSMDGQSSADGQSFGRRRGAAADAGTNGSGAAAGGTDSAGAGGGGPSDTTADTPPAAPGAVTIPSDDSDGGVGAVVGQETPTQDSQALDVGTGPGSGGGFGDGPGGGLGRGGISGSVSSIEPGTLAIDTAQGESREFSLGDSTQYLRESAIEAADIQAGDPVRIGFAFPGFADGQAAQLAQPDTESNVATRVTMLPPGTEMTQVAGGPGRRGGRGFAPTQGAVVGIADGGLMVALPDGQNQLVATDPSTTYLRDVAADPSELVVGDQVRVGVARGGFGARAAQDAASAPLEADSVTIIDASVP